MILAEIKPPIIKQMVATNDENCRFDSPVIECPLVQPPAYLVPKPTKNPPTIKKKRPLNVKIFAELKMSFGKILEKSRMPSSLNADFVLSAITN